MEDLLKVGVITTTHGVRGEVKVFPTTDPERFLDLEYVILDAGREMKKLEIRNVKFFKNLVILKFDGIDNINDIEMYKGRDLWVPREEAHPFFSSFVFRTKNRMFIVPCFMIIFFLKLPLHSLINILVIHVRKYFSFFKVGSFS